MQFEVSTDYAEVGELNFDKTKLIPYFVLRNKFTRHAIKFDPNIMMKYLTVDAIYANKHGPE